MCFLIGLFPFMKKMKHVSKLPFSKRESKRGRERAWGRDRERVRKRIPESALSGQNPT